MFHVTHSDFASNENILKNDGLSRYLCNLKNQTTEVFKCRSFNMKININYVLITT